MRATFRWEMDGDLGDLSGAAGKLHRELVRATQDVATVLEKQIQARLRAGTGKTTLATRSGHYRRNVQRRAQVKGLKAAATVWVDHTGGRGVRYARIHEYGGVIKGKPWLYFKPTRPLADGRMPPVIRKRQVTIPARPVWRTSYLRQRKRAARRFDIAVERWLESI